MKHTQRRPHDLATRIANIAIGMAAAATLGDQNAITDMGRRLQEAVDELLTQIETLEANTQPLRRHRPPVIIPNEPLTTNH